MNSLLVAEPLNGAFDTHRSVKRSVVCGHVAGRYWSGSGGQADFARGAMYSPEGQGFVALHSTAKGGTISRIVSQLGPGQVVTTQKNTVDKVVTEWGVAELRGRSIHERARSLIRIAHPDHRDRLAREAKELGFV